MGSTFISTSELHSLIYHKNDDQVIIVDSRYYLADPQLAYEEYKLGHIPGAIFADLDKDLSGPIVENTGRHPLPELRVFKDWLTSNSISKFNRVIVYDQVGGGIAARLWFMLSQIGFEYVYVLEGGIIDWKNAGYPLESGVNQREVSLKEIDASLPDHWEDGIFRIYSKSEIKQLIHTDFILVDSRSPERYTGEEEPIDPVAGHIPNAKNLFWQSNLDENLKLKFKDLIKPNFENIINTDKLTAFYCGSGVTAAFNLLLMEHLNLPRSGIFVGSWSEWIRN
jgi:thiosulfate/3-mercaptopyruvate sulfurtransferase